MVRARALRLPYEFDYYICSSGMQAIMNRDIKDFERRDCKPLSPGEKGGSGVCGRGEAEVRLRGNDRVVQRAR